MTRGIKRKRSRKTNGRRKKLRRSRKIYKAKRQVAQLPLYRSTKHGLLPDMVIRSLSYVSVKSYNASATASDVNVYRLNDLFDPDLTGTGGQPYGFDQMMTYFNNFCVIKTKWKAVMFQQEATENIVLSFQPCAQALFAQYYDSDDPTTIQPNTLAHCHEFPHVCYKLGTSNNSNITLRGSRSIEKCFHTNRKAMMSNNLLEYCGTAAAGPTKQAYIKIGSAPVYQDPPGRSIAFFIKYTAVFFNPISFGGS